MKNDGIRRHVVSALQHLARTAFDALGGVMVEEKDDSIVVRYPALGAHWKHELSMEVNGYVAAPGTPLTDFLAKEPQVPAVAVAVADKPAQSTKHLPRLIIDAVLFCPHCGARHVDSSRNDEKWHRRAHTTHRCQSCGGDFDVYVSGQAGPERQD